MNLVPALSLHVPTYELGAEQSADEPSSLNTAAGIARDDAVPPLDET
jgi:hypothetical protein